MSNEYMTEAEYQRMQREQCDPHWTLTNFAIAFAVVFAWLFLIAVLEGSL